MVLCVDNLFGFFSKRITLQKGYPADVALIQYVYDDVTDYIPLKSDRGGKLKVDSVHFLIDTQFTV